MNIYETRKFLNNNFEKQNFLRKVKGTAPNIGDVKTKAKVKIREQHKTVREILDGAGLAIMGVDFVYDMNKELVGVVKNNGEVHIFTDYELKKIKKYVSEKGIEGVL